MEARFFTDIGARNRNEDSGGVCLNHTEQMMLVICDGMGGHNAGDVASQFVANALTERFEQENLIEFNQAEDWLKTNIIEINRQLFQLSHMNDENQDMGTTLVAALIYDHQVIIANIGDSRAYLVNERELRQITNDHTFVNHLVLAGELSKEEAAVHPQRHMITKVMGSDRRVMPDIFIYDISHYDYLLLNSDGLTDYVPESVIHTVLKQHDLQQAGTSLIETAITNEARDNVSFVLCRLGGDA